MKKTLFLIVAVFITISAISQKELVITNNDESKVSISLSDLRKLTFPKDTMKVFKKSNEIASYPVSEIQTLSFNEPSIVSVMEAEDKTEANLYPNPAKDKVSIEFYSNLNSKTKITIYDGMSKVVYQNEVLSNVGLNNHEVNISKLLPGIYYCSIQNNQLSKNIVFIKK